MVYTLDEDTSSLWPALNLTPVPLYAVVTKRQDLSPEYKALEELEYHDGVRIHDEGAIEEHAKDNPWLSDVLMDDKASKGSSGAFNARAEYVASTLIALRLYYI
nr:hypothetical protein CFP56_33404 [Quercus suber]